MFFVLCFQPVVGWCTSELILFLLNLLIVTNLQSHIQLPINIMDTSTMDSNLLIFQHELPDSDQELYIQHTSTFTPFSELPLEIRQKIWRDTFPKVTHCLFFRNARSHKRDLTFPKKSPIASRVNQESRMETLRNYRVLEHKLIYVYPLPTSPKDKYLFWNPTIDKLKTDFYGAFDPSLRIDFNMHLQGDWNEFAQSVLFLEVWHGYWVRVYNDYFENGQLSGLNDFKGLLNLHILYPSPSRRKRYEDIENTLWRAGGRECLRSLNEYFKSGVIRGDRKIMPQVSVMSEATRHPQQA
jgi:hypothetical protein